MQSCKYKISILGNSGIGKRSLILQFGSGIYDEDTSSYDFFPFASENPTKQMEVDGKQIMLYCDRCEVDAMRRMVPPRLTQLYLELIVNTFDGIVLMYSITDQSSFEVLRDIKEEILRAKGIQNVPIILVGNKSDLEVERVVSKLKGLRLSREFDCVFIEISAKASTNIDEMFYELVSQINGKYFGSKRKSVCTLL